MRACSARQQRRGGCHDARKDGSRARCDGRNWRGGREEGSSPAAGASGPCTARPARPRSASAASNGSSATPCARRMSAGRPRERPSSCTASTRRATGIGASSCCRCSRAASRPRAAAVPASSFREPSTISGPTPFPVLREGSPQNPMTRKGKIRVEMEQRLSAAADKGLRSLVLRAGDFFGPGAANNWFSQGLVKPGRAVRGSHLSGAPRHRPCLGLSSRCRRDHDPAHRARG